MDSFPVPHNQEVEQGLLGALFVDNRAYDRITEKLLPEHFYIHAHQRIYAAMQKRLDCGQPVSAAILKTQFEGDGDLKDVGGGEYLSFLMSNVITVINTPEYATEIKNLWVRRQLILAADQIAQLAKDMQCESVMQEADRLITAVTHGRDTKQSTAGAAAQRAIQWMQDLANGKIKPMRTGLQALDDRITGFFPGRLYVVGARPGMGKTAFAVTIADNMSVQWPSFFVSMEMTAEELSQRLIAARTSISIDRQQNAQDIASYEWQAITRAQHEISQQHLEILDAAGSDLNAIRSAARRHRRKFGEFVLFIDYLGLMALDQKKASKVHQIEDVTVGLKSLAKELGIPIVLLCQLNRGIEGREDKTPMPSDLRDSGAIEQDADVILFINRPEVYLENKEPFRGEKDTDEIYDQKLRTWRVALDESRGKAEIYIAKNRQGRRCKLNISFDGECQRFE